MARTSKLLAIILGLIIVCPSYSAFARNPEPTATPCPCKDCAKKTCLCYSKDDKDKKAPIDTGESPDSKGSCSSLNNKDGKDWNDCTASCPAENYP